MMFMAVPHILAAMLLSAADTTTAAAKIDGHGATLSAGPVKLNLGGRLHLDGAVFDPSSGLSSTSDVKVRRARLELSGTVSRQLRFRADREFAGRSKGWRNLWVEVDPSRNTALRSGNFLVPFSQERLESSNSSAFVERSLAAALSPGYGLGGAAFANGRRWTFAAGWFGRPLGKKSSSTERGQGFVGRGTIVPWKSGRRFVQLGIAAEKRTFNVADRIRFSADPGSTLAPTIISTGSYAGLDSLFALNAQAAISLGSFLIQAEEFKVRLETDSGTNHFDGQTLQARWMPGGERYGYAADTAVFTGPDLKHGKTAVELAVRYSRLDLTSGHIEAGVASELSAGANWYLSRNIRTMIDYTYVRNDRPAGRADVTNHVLAARLQFAL